MERPDQLPRATINHGDQDNTTYYPQSIVSHDGHVLLLFGGWKMRVPWERVVTVCESFDDNGVNGP
jgi:hypothetical protein